MDASEFKGSPLAYVEGRELNAVTFLHDYLQLHFDGPFINCYVWPRIQIGSSILDKLTRGYRDALCEQIGKVVIAAVVEPNKAILVHLEHGVCIDISLRDEDRVGPESAMFQDGTGKLWNVW